MISENRIYITGIISSYVLLSLDGFDTFKTFQKKIHTQLKLLDIQEITQENALIIG